MIAAWNESVSLSSRHVCRWPKAQMLVWIWCMLLAICHLKLHAADTWQDTHYQRLERDLLTNYSATVRPVLDVKTANNLSVMLSLYSIYEIDEVAQTLTQNSVMVLTWRDELLQWDPQQYGEITATELSSTQVWLPYMEALNVVSGSRVMSSDATTKVVVNATGHVKWFYQDMWKTACRMDITYFPFDTQSCDFKVFLWTSEKSVVAFTDVRAQKDDFFVDNAEWLLLSFDKTVAESPLERKIYSGFTVTFHVKRRRIFHTLTLILPNVLLALLATLVFLLPAESGEKMSFIMGLLLATGVSMTVLMNTMPRSSLDISLLMIYLTALSMTTALSVVASACILSCSSLDGTVGPKMAIIILFLRKLTGNTRHQGCYKKGRNSKREHIEVNDCEDNATKDESFEGKCKALAVTGLHGAKQDRCFSREITLPEASGPNVIFWKDAAATLDRVCFRISIGVVVGMTFVLIIVLLLGSS